MLRARVITESAELERLAPEWRRLLTRASHPQPVLTPMWLLTWWREFGCTGGGAVRSLAFEDAGGLVGLLPLARRATTHRATIPVRRLELLGTGEPEADEICSEYLGALV